MLALFPDSREFHLLAAYRVVDHAPTAFGFNLATNCGKPILQLLPGGRLVEHGRNIAPLLNRLASDALAVFPFVHRCPAPILPVGFFGQSRHKLIASLPFDLSQLLYDFRRILPRVKCLGLIRVVAIHNSVDMQVVLVVVAHNNGLVIFQAQVLKHPPHIAGHLLLGRVRISRVVRNL